MNSNSNIQKQPPSESKIKSLRFYLPQTKNPILRWRKTKILIWELLGTAIFAYGICASTNDIFISCSLLAGILIVGSFTGGHLNPGVSFSFFMKGEIGIFDFLFRAIGQTIGAFIGAFFSFIVLNQINAPTIKKFSYTWEHLEFLDLLDGENPTEQQQEQIEKQEDIYGIYHAFMGEFLASFFFYFVVLLMTDKKTTLYTENNKLMPIITIVLGFHAARGFTPRTGGSLNPAMGTVLTIWLAIYTGDENIFNPFFVYLITPFISASLAGLYYKFIHTPLALNQDIQWSKHEQKIKSAYDDFLASYQKTDVEQKRISLKTPLNEKNNDNNYD